MEFRSLFKILGDETARRKRASRPDHFDAELAEITPDDDYEFADKVGAKYGADLRQMDQPGEPRVVVTIRPARVTTWGGPPES